MTDGDELAARLAADVEALLSDDRKSHGDAVENHEHLAQAWTWYLRGRGLLAEDADVMSFDAARMMVLAKLSRAAVGDYDIDHDRDISGYGSIAGACAVVAGEAEEDEIER